MSLDKSKRIRSGNRSFVTKIIQNVHNAIDKFGGSQTEKDLLESYKITLEDKKNILEKLDETILGGIDDEDKIDDEIFNASEFGESINRVVVKINSVLKLTETSEATLSTVENPNQSNGGTQSFTSHQARAKLPKLSLKRFSGKPTEWQSFWDSYNAAVHSNEHLSKVDKFNYLKSLLEGPAASAITGFALTDENYETAVQLLEDRFANPQVIISSHMDALLKLEEVSDILDVGKIRRLYNSIETHIRSLDNLKISSESYGTLLVPLVLAKIPEEMRLLISRKVGKDNLKMDNLLKEFKAELEARERCSLLSTSTQNKRDSAKKKGEFPSTSSSLFTGGENHHVQLCSFCNQQHLSAKCNLVTDVSTRRAVLRRRGKCFACLRSGHIASNCPSKWKCPKCGDRHHISLCEGSKRKDDQTRSHNERKPPEPSGKETSATICINSSTSVLLQTARAMVGKPSNPQEKREARIVFDSCSQRSYISHRLQKALKLSPVTSDSLLVKTFGNESPRLMSCDLVQMSITATDGMELYVNAYSVPVICSPISNQVVELAVEKYPHLQGLTLADEVDSSHEAEIDILIGADYYWNLVTSVSRRGEQSVPVALLTKLGWVLSGPVSTSCGGEPTCTTNINATHVLRIDVQREPDEELKEQLKKFWDLETIGIRNDEKSVYDNFIEEVQFNGERYEAKLPFKEHHPLIPDNHAACVKRLGSLIRRLQDKPTLLREYDKIIREQINSGIVEPVHPGRAVKAGTVHYFPHREVVRTDKNTTKIRVVYDASAKSMGPSLNDCLYAGPPLTPLIFDILLRFRVHPVAVVADIEKAFLNIEIAPKHRDFLRFLWVDDPFSKTPIMQLLRFTRVVFGVTSSPFILNATLRHHVNRYLAEDPEFVQELLRSLYVDDYASGSESVSSALELSRKIKHRLAMGGFNMRKWLSNSTELMEMFQTDSEFVESSQNFQPQSPTAEEDQGYTQSVLGAKVDVYPRILGQAWDTRTDKFVINLDKVIADIDPNVVTKRMVLSRECRGKVLRPIRIDFACNSTVEAPLSRTV